MDWFVKPVLLFWLFPSVIAQVSNGQDKIFHLPKPNERCCEKEIFMLKRVINTPGNLAL